MFSNLKIGDWVRVVRDNSGSAGGTIGCASTITYIDYRTLEVGLISFPYMVFTIDELEKIEELSGNGKVRILHPVPYTNQIEADLNKIR